MHHTIAQVTSRDSADQNQLVLKHACSLYVVEFFVESHKLIDVDECQEDLHNCSHNCSNTEGSYQCTCQDGYSLDALDNSTCHPHGTCTQRMNMCNIY